MIYHAIFIDISIKPTLYLSVVLIKIDHDLFLVQDVFDFWIKKGVDGLLMDDVHTIFENEDLTQDEPFNEFAKDPQPVR